MKENTSDQSVVTASPITLTPVGVVRSEIKKPMLRADEDGISLAERRVKLKTHRRRLKTLVSELIIDPDLSGILDGIEGYSHILVLYWPHLVPETRRSLRKVHPLGRKDIPAQGIFATCSPARPNPILITAVRLLDRKENVLRVEGLEAVDGSPVIDIKPYNPGYYRVETPTVPEWLTRINRELADDSTDG